MANSGIAQKMMGYSPHIEMIIRRIYRNNLFNRILSRLKLRSNPESKVSFDFNAIIDYLKEIGVKNGDILIVHSAFKPLKPSGLKPDEIIDALLELIGQDGTLVMPVIRKYPEYPSEDKVLSTDVSDVVFLYDVQKSDVWTGIIPKTLMNRSQAVTSRIPLNTITALGPDANRMFKNELLDEIPAPNGSNSAWKYCTDKNAWVVSIGTDLTHSLTMIHTAEDVLKESWPVLNWYRKLNFRIVDKDFEITKTVLERHPRWGRLYFGERKLSADLIKDKIIKSTMINGILIESLKSLPLYEYLNMKNKKGYPYFWLNKYLKK